MVIFPQKIFPWGGFLPQPIGLFEITVVIEDIPQQTVSISGQNLTSVVSWYNYILNTTGIKSKYILFAKSQDHNIGSGCCF